MTDKKIKSITTLIDTAVLDELKSIMEDEFADVLQIFLDESVTLMSEVFSAFEEESDNMIRSVHTLKSCSRNVGAMHLGMIAEKMEENLINKDVAAAKSKLDELQDTFTQSHARIKKCMQDNMDEMA
jgi:HPt (histidine-containing phosphotransfer) domain-containing protein